MYIFIFFSNLINSLIIGLFGKYIGRQTSLYLSILFKDYKSILCDALRIVEEQENIDNKRQARAVQASFKGIENLVTVQKTNYKFAYLKRP